MNKNTIITIVVIIIIIIGGWLMFQKIVTNKGIVIIPKNESASNEIKTNETNLEEKANSEVSSNMPIIGNIETETVVENKTEDKVINTTKEFTVTGTNYKFEPSMMSVNVGDTVKITFKDINGFHDFVIDEFNVATKKLNTGNEQTVTFTADKAGSFQYYCSVGSHRSMGMQGVLVVK